MGRSWRDPTRPERSFAGGVKARAEAYSVAEKPAQRFATRPRHTFLLTRARERPTLDSHSGQCAVELFAKRDGERSNGWRATLLPRNGSDPDERVPGRSTSATVGVDIAYRKSTMALSLAWQYPPDGRIPVRLRLDTLTSHAASIVGTSFALNSSVPTYHRLDARVTRNTIRRSRKRSS